MREREARSNPGGIGAYKRSNETPLLCICFKESVCTGEVFVLELLRKNIHMDRIKGEAQTQIVLEDDINITDAKPDVFILVTEKGDIQTEEIRVMEDHVHVRGKLHFCVFYLSDEEIHRAVLAIWKTFDFFFFLICCERWRDLILLSAIRKTSRGGDF